MASKDIRPPDGRIMKRCRMKGCENIYCWGKKDTNKHFYSFPKNPDLFEQWKYICGVPNEDTSKTCFVCEDHFYPRDFVNYHRERLNKGVVPHSTDTNDYVVDHDYCTNNDDIVPSIDVPVEVKVDDVSSTNSSLPLTETTPSNCNSVQKVATGILTQMRFSTKTMTPRELQMYKMYRSVQSKMCNARARLIKQRQKVQELQKMIDNKELMLNDLNDVASNFLKSQFRNVNRRGSGKRWSEADKIFALSIYKRSPKVYKFLGTNFQLPSTRHLKAVLSKIPFETGLNPVILSQLKLKMDTLNPLDKNCSLCFHEIVLSPGIHDEAHQESISAFEDLIHFSQSNRNNALVFMLRGMRKQWNQVIAYYFIDVSISSSSLKEWLITIIQELQEIGILVKATICDQESTHRKALSELAGGLSPENHHFKIKDQIVAIIFDVPSLMKCTSYALFKHTIQFEKTKFAMLQHISEAFRVDQLRAFKFLKNLKESDFKDNCSIRDMKVSTAARLLSGSVARAIESFVSAGSLRADAFTTAEFAEIMDRLFDSLNGYTLHNTQGKELNNFLTKNSPHFAFWNNLLPQLANWRVLELSTGEDVTDKFEFTEGWQITINSVKYLWTHLGYKNLNLRNLNLDPMDNLFCTIRKDCASNKNPTSDRFVQALKTVVMNNLLNP